MGEEVPEVIQVRTRELDARAQLQPDGSPLPTSSSLPFLWLQVSLVLFMDTVSFQLVTVSAVFSGPWSVLSCMFWETCINCSISQSQIWFLKVIVCVWNLITSMGWHSGMA